MTERTPDIARLWSEVRTGNVQAFESVVRDFQDAVAAVAFAGTGDLAGSEDIAQETFLSAWQQREQLREPSRLGGWLCGIARNLAKQWHRTRAAHKWASPDGGDRSNQLVDSAPGPVQRVISGEERQLVWNSLESIPEIYREVLVLFYRQSQSVEEVARALELSDETVRQRLSRGRGLLRMEVARTVEQTLQHTRPGPQFTIAVMTSLASFQTFGKAAGGAVAGSLAAKAAGSAVGAAAGKVLAGGAAAGLAGGAIGAAGGLGGAWLGTWLPAQLAPTLAERKLLEQSGRRLFRGAVVFTLLVILSCVPYFFRGFAPVGVLLQLLLTAGFTGWTVFTNRKIQKQILQIRQSVRPEDDPNPTWVKARLGLGHGPTRPSRWVGRRGTCTIRWWGWPLWDFQVSTPASAIDGKQSFPLHARGWLAVGDRATGFIAIGGRSTGVVAIGGICFGLVSFGGCAIGLLAAVGGLALGTLALGGGAVGYSAAGGGALGWQSAGGAAIGAHSAVGGLAIALEKADGGLAISGHFAVGGQAIAREANTPRAREAVQSAWLANLLGTQQALLDPAAYQRKIRGLVWKTVIPAAAFSLLFPLFFYRLRKPAETGDENPMPGT